MIRILITAVVLAGFMVPGNILAQSDKPVAVPINIIQVKAEVIGVLHDQVKLAVIRIAEVDTANSIGLKANQEVLVEFVFSTQPNEEGMGLKGISGGEIINAELDGKYNPGTRQFDYRVFRYSVLKRPKKSD